MVKFDCRLGTHAARTVTKEGRLETVCADSRACAIFVCSSPQSYMTQAEIREIILSPRQVVSPQANKPVMGIVQTRCWDV